MDKRTQRSKNDDGQKQFFTDEYRREGAFLINRKVAESSDNDVELKTSVTKSDKID